VAYVGAAWPWPALVAVEEDVKCEWGTDSPYLEVVRTGTKCESWNLVTGVLSSACFRFCVEVWRTFAQTRDGRSTATLRKWVRHRSSWDNTTRVDLLVSQGRYTLCFVAALLRLQVAVPYYVVALNCAVMMECLVALYRGTPQDLDPCS